MRQPEESQNSTFHCAYCGEVNHTIIDPSQGKTQKYIEDCQICCKPNNLSVSYDKWNKDFIIQSHQSQ
ncbi:CPXCG motif-containing cysteine-rich protein [Fodinibius saliphilus]|uniref:CPXCG motif-containing cysteine-rich protein n=1 Tax=Fodinibius saliphilus TaxID=1920650 RepID=UPI00110991B1